MEFWLRRAASNAASFARLRRSAPTRPGVEAAISLRSTSVASGMPRVWTRRIISRPSLSGGCTVTRRSNRPGRRRAWSSTSGRLVAADDHFHDLAGAHTEDRHVGLTRYCTGQQRLAGARRADEQHAFGYDAAQAGVLLGILEKIDHLDELRLGLFDAGHVGEGHGAI